MSDTTRPAHAWTSLPFYQRVTIAGLLVYGLVFLVFGITLIASGNTESLVFILIFLIPTAIFAGLAWRFGRRMALVAAIWALLNLLLNGPFILPALLHVNSFFDFGMGVPVIVALAITAVAGIVAFLQHGRGTARTVATRGERWVFATIAVTVVALMALSGVLHVTTLASVDAADKVAAVKVDMKNMEFRPTDVRVSSAEPSKLVIKNRDFTVHTFTIKELGVDVTITGGSEKLVQLPALAAGTYEYVCTVVGHEEMRGTLKVSS